MARTMLRLLLLPLMALIGATALACSASSIEQTPSIEVTASTVVLDVRTPEEYAEGHLDGAVNLPLQSDDFAQRIAALDPDADYVVYCRTGNRSAQAVAAMTDAGFTSVTDAGGIDSASDATGLEIVT